MNLNKKKHGAIGATRKNDLEQLQESLARKQKLQEDKGKTKIEQVSSKDIPKEPEEFNVVVLEEEVEEIKEEKVEEVKEEEKEILPISFFGVADARDYSKEETEEKPKKKRRRSKKKKTTEVS